MEDVSDFLEKVGGEYIAAHPGYRAVSYSPESLHDVHRANIFYDFMDKVGVFKATPEIGENLVALQVAREDSLVSLVLQFDHDAETFSTKLKRGDRNLQVDARAKTAKISKDLVEYFQNPASFKERKKSQRMSNRLKREIDEYDPKFYQ